MSPKVSVIIPVFHALEYISKTIENLKNQTLREIEFIFIDDKGNDGSFDVVIKEAASDPRIVCLYNEENRGPGFSRNRGIEAARGEFIAFADADDLLSSDFYEKLYNKAKETGALAVKSSVVIIELDGHHQFSTKNSKIKEDLQKNPDSMLNLWIGEHWAGIYSRDLVMRSGARNNETSNIAEDTHFQMMFLIHVKPNQFALEESVVYYYVQHSDSLYHNQHDEKWLEELKNSAAAKIDFMMQHLNSSDNLRYLAGLFSYRLSIMNSGLNSISELNWLKYIDFFARIIREWYSSGLPYFEFKEVRTLRELEYNSNAFYFQKKYGHLINQCITDATTILKQEHSKRITKLEHLISILSKAPKLKRRLQINRFKLLFAFGKRRKALKQQKALIQEQLKELKKL